MPPLVATPSVTARPRAPYRSYLTVLLAALLALATVLSATGAVAEPRGTAADAQAELNRLNREVDDAVENYAEARIALARATRRAAALRARATKAEGELAAVKAQIGALSAAAYRSGGADQLVSLLTTSDPRTFIDRATTLDQIARGQTEQLRELRIARRKMKAEQAAADQAVGEQRAVERRLAGVRRAIESKVSRQQALLAQLDRDARRAAVRAAAARTPRASRSVRPYTGNASGRSKIAVQAAVAQLGKPYRWGAAGPNSFDCSGLTMWAWGKAGVSLPHSSRAQYHEGRHVSRSELLPGDLVFFGSPIHHVGIYVGNGTYIAAPQTGDVVSYRSLARGDYAGAVRL